MRASLAVGGGIVPQLPRGWGPGTGPEGIALLFGWRAPNCYAITTSNPFRPPLRSKTAPCVLLAPGRPRGRGLPASSRPDGRREVPPQRVRPAAHRAVVLLADGPRPHPRRGGLLR